MTGARAGSCSPRSCLSLWQQALRGVCKAGWITSVVPAFPASPRLCIFPSFMTRSDLVDELAALFPQLPHRDAEMAVKTILDCMADALARGHRIEIRGFGSFSISHRPARMGRNPRSGESVEIPEKRVPHFKPGKALREAVDRQGDHDDAPSAGEARVANG